MWKVLNNIMLEQGEIFSIVGCLNNTLQGTYYLRPPGFDPYSWQTWFLSDDWKAL